MLVAVDFSDCGRHTAQYAFDTARAIGGTVTLLHVLEGQASGPLSSEAAQTLLRELSLQARRPPKCLVVPAGNEFDRPGLAADSLRGRVGPEAQVASAILAVADGLDADLILLGPHGQGNTDSRALGQVAQHVLLNARQPVQVVPCNTHRPTLDRWERVFAGMTAHPLLRQSGL
jgi:nucleotide-binding universal stress UspA family protein